jgi:uncharacterized protein (TIGR03435 family)
MTPTQCRLYAAIIRLHPADFRNRFGREMLHDFEDASATHHPATLYLDALLFILRQWASHLFPPALELLPAQASLLSGQYVSLSQPNPSPFELLRASCIAALLFSSIGFATAPPLGVGQIANPGARSTSTSSANPTVHHSAHGILHAGTLGSAIATFGATTKSALAKPDEATTYEFDLSPVITYAAFLCLYFALRSFFSKRRVLRSIFVTAVTLSIAAPMHAQSMYPAALLPSSEAAHAQGSALSFDIVTVKLSDPAKEHLALYWRQPDGLKWDGVTLRGIIANAYGVSSIIRYQIVGGPDWMGSRAFDINAKVDDQTTARWSKMTQQAVDEERRSMMRTLLAERFHLKFHHETREMPALVLRVAKSGSKLQPPHPEHDLQAGTPPSRINFFGHGHMEGHSALMSNLSRSLASEPEIAGRPVVDKTGLTGGYDFTLRWTPDDPASGADPADPNAQWPSLFTAVDEQLGLKLTQEKQPIDIIVVDSVEMPGEN